MTFRQVTELQEQSRNAAHRSAITHRVEMNHRSQVHHRHREIEAGYGSRPDME
jgi:hypothetical protein